MCPDSLGTPGPQPLSRLGCLRPRPAAERPRAGRPSRLPLGWRSGRRARPAGREGEAGGSGQPRLSPEEAPGGHIAELSAVSAAPLLSSCPALSPPPLPPCRSPNAWRRCAAPQPVGARAGTARSRVSHRRPPFPLPGFAADVEVMARSCGALAARRWRRRPGLARLSSRPAGRGAAALSTQPGRSRSGREPRGPAESWRAAAPQCPVRAEVPGSRAFLLRARRGIRP